MSSLPRRRVLVLVVLLGLCEVSLGAADPWHNSLCLSGGGRWRQRIRVVVHNETDRALAGQPVAVAVGKGDGEADLAGAAAEGLRVCNARGVEGHTAGCYFYGVGSVADGLLSVAGTSTTRTG